MSQSRYSQRQDAGAISGVRVARVTANEDPEKLGRVQIQYPWRAEKDHSDWARVATDMTGNDYGTYYLPEVGAEVLVAFENGDVHQPVVVGSLWSGKRKPPEDNGDGKNDIRTITTRSGHKIEFNDNSKEGSVSIQTTAGHKIVMNDKSGSESVTIEDNAGNSLKMDAAGKKIEMSAKQEISLDAPTIKLSAKSAFEVSSNGKVAISGTGKVDVSSNGQLNLKSNGLMGINAAGPMTIKGAIIQLN